GVDEGALVLAHVQAVQPVATRRRDTREPQARHGRATIGLVEDDRRIQLPDAHVKLAHVVLGAGDVLDEEDALAVVADRVELEVAVQMDLVNRLSVQRVDQQDVGYAGARTREWIEYRSGERAGVVRAP